VTETGYVTIKDAEMFDSYTDHVRFIIRIVGLVILTGYLIYFAVVSFLVLRVIRLMKKSYKWVICMTLVVVLTSIVILFLNGHVQTDFEKPVLFVA
jgi:uncharacterized membrane protein (DUF485 family)